MSAVSTTEKPQLLRGLGTWATLAMVVGNIIGTGVFLVASPMARATHSVALVFAVWIVGGLLSLFGALAIAELGAAIPEAGGSYVFLNRGFGPKWGFMFGWMNNLIGKPSSASTIAAGLLIFASSFFPGVTSVIFSWTIDLPLMEKPYVFNFTWAQPLAALAILAVTTINYLGVRLAGQVQIFLTTLKVGSILAIVVLGFAMSGSAGAVAQSSTLAPLAGSVLVVGFFTAMARALWAYDGWIDITLAASEVRNPQRNLPLAIIGGTLLVAVIYLLANATYFHVLSLDAVAASRNVARDAVATFAGAGAAGWINAAMMISALGALNSSILTGARVPYAMARDGRFFPVTASIHPRYHTPAGALVFQGVAASLMVMTGSFEELSALFIFAQWIFYGLAVAAVIALRRKEPNLPRPYRTFGYPVLPVLFILGALALTLNILYTDPYRSSLGLLVILSGLLFYRRWEKKTTS